MDVDQNLNKEHIEISALGFYEKETRHTFCIPVFDFGSHLPAFSFRLQGFWMLRVQSAAYWMPDKFGGLRKL